VSSWGSSPPGTAKDGKQLANLLAERAGPAWRQAGRGLDIEAKCSKATTRVRAGVSKGDKKAPIAGTDNMRHYLCSLVKLDRATDAQRDAERQ